MSKYKYVNLGNPPTLHGASPDRYRGKNPCLAVAPVATGISTHVEHIRQIQPYFAKQSQYAGLRPETRNTKPEILRRMPYGRNGLNGG